jgi:phospholipase C
MGYHDRSQIPFYYWLADNYTICDNWYSSVLGPTWPNRYYLHSATAAGKKTNTPIVTGLPDTVWDRLKAAKKTYKNYYAGAISWYFGGFLGKLGTMNPGAQIGEFFDDAKAGKLPNFSMIDPDFMSNDDHPSHDVRTGQAFVATIYEALAKSPQWDRLLFIITYDEHGGFFDHAPPPAAKDEYVEFQRRGFRVPTIVMGGRVKRGAVVSTVFEHASVLATVGTRFKIASLGKRMDESNDLSSCIDPLLVDKAQAAPAGMPVVTMSLKQAVAERVGTSSQPELERMVADGTIPNSLVDPRSHEERISTWLKHGERLGAIRLF